MRNVPVAPVTGNAAVRRLGLLRQLHDTRRLVWFAGFIGVMAAGFIFFPDRDLARAMFLGGLVGMLAQWRGTCSSVVEVPADAMPA